ncbi:hypothetical protein BH747_06785 [Enterococcus villorum]|uniref:Uncharacterized protein n=1 Tax=Enterococcus villorum TaxID=112904 RepID=A0A1V8YWZ0_9ENTE|nr:hypothetical protein [Enterococcus villorum]OQO70399.1 hypothetical protein BH747_06785 [Enterococcus villorum]OQO77147.1 hypothetical protein BH744_00250 [Enterococcus villorum]
MATLKIKKQMAEVDGEIYLRTNEILMQIAEQRAQTNCMINQIEEITKQINARENETSYQGMDIDQLKKQKTRLENNVHSLNKQIEKLEEDFETLNSESKEKRGEAFFKIKLEELEKQNMNGSMAQQINELKKTQKRYLSTIDRFPIKKSENRLFNYKRNDQNERTIIEKKLEKYHLREHTLMGKIKNIIYRSKIKQLKKRYVEILEKGKREADYEKSKIFLQQSKQNLTTHIHLGRAKSKLENKEVAQSEEINTTLIKYSKLESILHSNFMNAR